MSSLNQSSDSRYKRWVSFSQALKEYELTRDQLEAALRFGLVEFKMLSDKGRLVKKSDIEDKLNKIKNFPERCWVFKTVAMRKYKLTRRQLEEAMKRGLIRFYEIKNPYYSRSASYMLFEPDIMTNLEEIKEIPKYYEEELTAKKIYNLKSKLRGKLGFYCPRCGEFIRVRRDSTLFEEMLDDLLKGEGIEEFRKAIILAHYRHEHTDYDQAKDDVERWLSEEERKKWRGLIAYYEGHKHDMDRFEREEYIWEIRVFRSTAVSRAKKHYGKVAAELAISDGLIKPKEHSEEEKVGETPSHTGSN